MNDPTTRSFALLFAPQIIVHNTSPDGSLRGAATDLGIKCITIEIGHPSQFHSTYVKYTVGGLLRILQSEELNMISEDGIKHFQPQETQGDEDETTEHVDVDDEEMFIPVVCAKSRWIFSSVGGIIEVYPKLGQWVKKGSVIARTFTIFGEEKFEYIAEDDGVIIGKNVNPSSEQGGRILHLGSLDSEFKEKSQDGHE
eukprot:TRINITY_DN4601_c0_g1_i1.p1 TRINITY_DN4601_c0_g1~~TRINITY_DN4601_c0_g1_i1.p1  ORF type:complete len:198 (+),score=70.54 TRINITY_DN4601_c0_g1_i1:215-808(+)